MNSGAAIARQTGWIPVRPRRRSAEWQPLVGLITYPGITLMQLDLLRRCIEGVGGEQFDFMCNLLCAFGDGIDDDCGETVRVVARGDRPGARQRVQFGDHINVVWIEPKRVGYNLCCNSRVPLAVRATAQTQRDLPAWIDGEYRAGICTRFGAGSAAVFCCLRQRNIAHIRAGRLYPCSQV